MKNNKTRLSLFAAGVVSAISATILQAVPQPCPNMIATHVVQPEVGPRCNVSTGDPAKRYYEHELEYTHASGSRAQDGDKMELDPEASHLKYTLGPIDPDICAEMTDSDATESSVAHTYYNEVPCCP